MRRKKGEMFQAERPGRIMCGNRKECAQIMGGSAGWLEQVYEDEVRETGKSHLR